MTKGRKWRTIVALTLPCAMTFSIGFSQWAFISPADGGGSATAGADARFLQAKGMLVQSCTLFTYQTYFYLDSERNPSDVGYVSFNIGIKPSALDDTMKIANSKGGYTFPLAISLSSDLDVFSQNEYGFLYFYKALMDETEIDANYENDKAVSFMAEIETASISDDVETCSLSVGFNNRLLSAYLSDLPSLTFNLNLWEGE